MSPKKPKTKQGSGKPESFDNHAFSDLRDLKEQWTRKDVGEAPHSGTSGSEKSPQAPALPSRSAPVKTASARNDTPNQGGIDTLGLSDEELFRMYLNGVLVLEETAQGNAQAATGVEDRERGEAKKQRMKAPELEEEAKLFRAAVEELSPGSLPAKDRHEQEVSESALPFFPELDLHGKTRVQAVRLLEAYLQSAYHHDIDTVEIIVGRGLHSADEPVLRSEVKRALSENRMRVVRKFYMGNPGVYVVELKHRKRH